MDFTQPEISVAIESLIKDLTRKMVIAFPKL
jgi:hypothetical protein